MLRKFNYIFCKVILRQIWHHLEQNLWMLMCNVFVLGWLSLSSDHQKCDHQFCYLLKYGQIFPYQKWWLKSHRSFTFLEPQYFWPWTHLITLKKLLWIENVCGPTKHNLIHSYYSCWLWFDCYIGWFGWCQWI